MSSRSGLFLGGDGPHDGPDPAGSAKHTGEPLADGALEDGGLDFLVFLLEGNVEGKPEAEEEREDRTVFFGGAFKFDAIEGSFVDFAHSVLLRLK